MDHLLYGAAYYDEYMPYERLDTDIEMMKRAGMNVVRIGESTWSTCEPQEGVFDFSHVTRVIEAMGKAGIDVIIGTPTYAVPTWMAKSHPEIIATTRRGTGVYGPRQNMDITNPAYLYYSERVIRRMMEECVHYDNVIGVQIDNETKAYDTAGNNVQQAFIKYLRKKFDNNLEALNRAYGLDYWSNRINAWEDFPDVRGTINASLGSEFDRFQRKIAADFLMWQRRIVEPYLREDQFITHNTDFNWVGYSWGLNAEVDVYEDAKAVTVLGTDIYHPSQDALTGLEIAFGGDITRCAKDGNYLVLETEAQGFAAWMPYPGQLRLQAYSHLAAGANMVEYWHWHSLHNAIETYWKGVLSQDFKENETYRACAIVGNEWKKIGKHLVNLKKNNKMAILVSADACRALEWHTIAGAGERAYKYNNVLMEVYEQLYRMNLACDFIWAQNAKEKINQYDLVIIPALYATDQNLLDVIEAYTARGGHIIGTFKTAFTDENMKVWCDESPHTLAKVFGISYSHFTIPQNVGLRSEVYDVQGQKAEHFMELLNPEGAQVLVFYDHPAWGEHAAITWNRYRNGEATYVGCGLSGELLSKVLADAARRAGISLPKEHFPFIVRSGVNDMGRIITYVFNYSPKEERFVSKEDSQELITGKTIRKGEAVLIKAWDLLVLES